MKKLTDSEKDLLARDLILIANGINGIRENQNNYLSSYSLSPESIRELDPYYLRAGGATMGIHFSATRQLATKIAVQRNDFSLLAYNGNELTINGTPVEEASRSFLWTPSTQAPNQWSRGRFQQKDHKGISYSDYLLMTFACNDTGLIRSMWAASVILSSSPDGKGDWSFSGNNAGFTSYTLTADSVKLPSYQQIIGTTIPDYGTDKGGDAKKGLKLKMESI